jgi:beta-glucosidase
MTAGGGSAHVNPAHLVTPYAGVKSRAGSGVAVTYAQGVADPNGELVDSQYLNGGLTAQFYNGTSMSGTPLLTRTDPLVNFIWGGASPAAGVPATGWSAKWTGTLTPPTTGTYTFALNSDDGSRLIINGQTVVNNWFNQPPTTRTGQIALTAGQPVSIEVDYFQDGGGSQIALNWQVPNQDLLTPAVNAARDADLAVVFVSLGAGEGADLSNIDLSGVQNQLVSSVAAAQANTVVVVNSGSAVTMPWAGNVRGIIESWYPGQEYGTAIAGLLFGDVNFSGKLPVTFPQSLSDVPAHTTAQWPGADGHVQYSEGLQVGYRWYDAQQKTPMFPFGFGLSYTTFSYANLTVAQPAADGTVAVGFDVTNTGTRSGAEVAQVYVSQPAAAGEPPRNLRGFRKVQLNPGQTAHVAVTLDARSFQTWANGAWQTTPGTHTIAVGASSRDIRLTGTTGIGAGAPVISLRAHANGKLVTAENAGAAPLIANRDAIGPWEQFDQVDAGNGWIALRSHANNQFVTAAPGQSLIANATAITQQQQFRVVNNSDGSISLVAAANNQYVCAENAGAASLIANRTAIGPWEEFDLLH